MGENEQRICSICGCAASDTNWMVSRDGEEWRCESCLYREQRQSVPIEDKVHVKTHQVVRAVNTYCPGEMDLTNIQLKPYYGQGPMSLLRKVLGRPLSYQVTYFFETKE